MICIHDYKSYGKPIKISYGYDGGRKLIYKTRCSKCGKESTGDFEGGYVGQLFGSFGR